MQFIVNLKDIEIEIPDDLLDDQEAVLACGVEQAVAQVEAQAEDALTQIVDHAAKVAEEQTWAYLRQQRPGPRVVHFTKKTYTERREARQQGA